MNGLLTEEWLYQKSSQEITSLLYEACLNQLEESIESIELKDFIKANEHLQKASDILVRLGAGLNYEAGILSDQLEQLYQYMVERLLVANLQKDGQIVEEIIVILNQLMTAWNEAMRSKKDQESNVIKQQKNRYEKLAIYDN
ncbi:flagellar biosynthesis protein FliS [Alkalihalobacillus alcalophilus ATCC 27647 = CGMCC 1.3604]|uniref:Flagellar biosynthesis protein FliS n=1 Tax=Alkalihalobacillus alcalophilus ATCC 27647 = CGMCC 1.3604 TaxID=1218173 RepID=A0A094XAT2_ALKAL|nr:flagellar export chaperone FliS [Alkalihalobacillus alcalophilus]KGA95885.1 flagellar biosynthesis protein FliS [Alkalihalobacillus alcalophilus ATCC 27647 = CGMCC 1.3604]MED1562895.1 flagellar export chaperone FliS [Alkalihalobacillus alcalophilus]THG90218.1 flagellar biosynthesis protein FliS [Alkalihalobacillus alcalophilus ATCC 27647 = CGMCC 1.3604]